MLYTDEMNKLQVGLAQINSTEDVDNNLETCQRFVTEAKTKNVEFLLFPEVFNFRKTGKWSALKPESLDGRSISTLKAWAKEAKLHILAGSICESIPNSKKVYNTSVLINPAGEINAVYRKIHLFDINHDEAKIQESKWYEAGKDPVVASIGDKQLGMSICYDLRFPELYRNYAKKGVEMISIPSSFTKPTGEAHWEVLCRARAIENQAYVLAPNQVGKGAAGVETYGNSLIIDPWGCILAQGGGNTQELLVSTLDFEKLEAIRNKLPSLRHRQL
ncbi:hydrolase [Candidatus Marinamargulisbacteria bacterium SCGC AAA071-K20]|nr:hydrolase [Candidatus Marinamargulisbacteria bacterium SCGC AAA071-K20]